jgi:hypothetical protein
MKHVLPIYSEPEVLISVEPEQSYGKLAQPGDNPPQRATADAGGTGARDDTHLVTDGPFAETHEQLRG